MASWGVPVGSPHDIHGPLVPHMPSLLPPAFHAPQLSETDATNLDAICRQHGVRLLLLRSYGLVRALRAICVRWHCLASA